MFSIVLFQPEIPPNTGNIIRLCANTGCQLHLVEPLGFHWNDKALQRAGLDYHEYATVQRHAGWDACVGALALACPEARWYALTTKGERRPDQAAFRPGDVLVFGSETRGLPPEVVATIAPERRLRLPMLAEQRSLNLSNAAAITVYEAWRQQGFAGAA
jgi:tRNA (cytidine/uridine-2'-O-)-methyltransferase